MSSRPAAGAGAGAGEQESEHSVHMSAPPGLRRARPADVPALAQMLARAFNDDPVATWSCPSEALRPGVLERFQALRLEQLIRFEDVWTSEDLTCAALWAPPGRVHTTPRQDLELMRCLIHPRLVWRLPLVARGLLEVQRNHPTDPPHWYLAVLGTDPSMQGKGLGSAVLAPLIERCDADGVAAYLESSKERNVDFYARHGFRVTGEMRLPRGPSVWPMWREPQARAT
ncbi:MAG TPA: GNAT family N-acetyltransferase [Solirubrobacteraceae bacterium]|nr:GNAT family N-acetyltransferase [Solirubrobacteraceae bacterium]